MEQSTYECTLCTTSTTHTKTQHATAAAAAAASHTSPVETACIYGARHTAGGGGDGVVLEGSWRMTVPSHL